MQACLKFDKNNAVFVVVPAKAARKAQRNQAKKLPSGEL